MRTYRYECFYCGEQKKSDEPTQNICPECVKREREEERRAQIVECNKSRYAKEEGIQKLLDVEKENLQKMSKDELIEKMILKMEFELEGLSDVDLSNRCGAILGKGTKIKV